MNKEEALEAEQSLNPAHPLTFLILVLPFGIITGYVTVTLAYLFSQAGVSVQAIAGLVGASLLPQVLKFLWAPLVDTSFTLKKWYVVSCFFTAAGILVIGILPIKASSIPFLTTIVIVANVAVSFLGVAVNGLAAHDTPHHLKGRASGYLQAGNLGGTGLGGGAGLWLAQHLSDVKISAAIIACSCLVCCLGLFFVKEYRSTVRTTSVIQTWHNLFTDVWATLKARMGVLALVLCFLPLGTGAASNLWAAVADDWHASANTVAFVTGLVSGFITAGGCLVGGWLCDRMDRQKAYIIFGMLQAASIVLMAYTPHTELLYIIWTTLYAFALGLSYAAFNAFVLEAIGKGAAGTKFTVYAAISNVPIYYMTLIDGWGHANYGPRGMLIVEAVFAVLGSLVFLALLKYAKGEKNLPATAFVAP